MMQVGTLTIWMQTYFSWTSCEEVVITLGHNASRYWISRIKQKKDTKVLEDFFWKPMLSSNPIEICAIFLFYPR